MFRVRLASGEEVVFQSVEELAQGIRSGAISASALLFHTKADRWVPITVHPQYSAARERADKMVVAVAPPQPEPALPTGDLGPGGTVPVYQMVSVSARELAARRRPRWILPGTGALSFLVFLMTVALVLQPGSEVLQDVLHSRQTIRGSSQSPARPNDTLAQDDPSRPIDPAMLAERLARSGETVSAAFRDSTSALGLANLLAPVRLASQESVAVLRQRLEAFRALRVGYLQAASTIEQAYEDSASRFAATGYWARVELVEWHARIVRLEDPKSAARTEDVLASLDSLYSLVATERDRVLFSDGRARFLRSAAGARYDRLRTVLSDYLSLPAPGERLPVPLQVLIQGLGPEPLPPARALVVHFWWLGGPSRWAFRPLRSMGFRRFCAGPVEHTPEIDGALDQLRGSLHQCTALPDLTDIHFHVLGIPATRVRDEGKRRKHEAQLGPETEQPPGYPLHVVLPAGDDEPGHLLLDQAPVMDRHLILDAVQPLHHSMVQRGAAAPPDGCRHQHHVRTTAPALHRPGSAGRSDRVR